MQSSELQNLKWEYKCNSARHLQQMTGAGFTFTPTLITKVHPRNTGCVPHPRSEWGLCTTDQRNLHPQKPGAIFYYYWHHSSTFLLKFNNSKKERGKRNRSCWRRKGNRWENNFTDWVKRNAREAQKTINEKQNPHKSENIYNFCHVVTYKLQIIWLANWSSNKFYAYSYDLPILLEFIVTTYTVKS